jgi:capsule polysaccharide export protein KpsE/RkpR
MSSASTEAATEAAAQPVVPAVSPAEAARALRHKRARKLVIGLVSWVLVPTLCATVYLGFIASERYESVASLALRGPDAATDAAMLREFIGSRAALKGLDGGGKWRAHFEENGDLFSGLADGASEESLFRYYRGQVDASFDAQASVLTVRTRAFSGKAAQQYNERLLQACDELLQGVGGRGAEDGIADAERVVASARAELLRVQRQLAEGELTESAASAEQRAALSALRLEKSLAKRSYESAQVQLEKARADRHKRTHILSLASPSLPDQAAYPRRGYGILTVFFAALALFGIGKLLVAAVREHAQF